VLDEATSALDSITEAAVQGALAAAREGRPPRATVGIAHRLSTTRAEDMIIVLEQAVVVERCAHAELLAAEGCNAALWLQQQQQQALAEAGAAPAGDAPPPAGASAGAPKSALQARPQRFRTRPPAPPPPFPPPLPPLGPGYWGLGSCSLSNSALCVLLLLPAVLTHHLVFVVVVPARTLCTQMKQ
jgi:hypothetical protein